MKKFLSLSIAFVCGLMAFATIPFSHALATGENKYLITATFNQEDNYQTTYNIDLSEVLVRARPFDTENEQMLDGASIVPTENSANHTFDRTYSTSAQTISQSDSIYVYLFFTTTNAHILSIVAQDGLTNSLSWTISAAMLNNQIVGTTETQNVRYGWMQIELPVAAAQKTGELVTVEQLHITYTSSSIDGSTDYAKLYFYAPYINTSLSENISFADKINYFLFKVKTKSANYVGESITYSSLSNLFQYCYIGDIDYLQYDVSSYHFKFLMINLNNGEFQQYAIEDRTVNFTYNFSEQASYQLDIMLCNQNDSIMWKQEILYEIQSFVALFINNGLAKMKIGQNFDYIITIHDRITSHQDIVATSSNAKVATAQIDEDGKLVVVAVGGGRTTITLKMTAQKDGGEAKEYKIEYVVDVASNTSVNWWIVGGTAIFLIVASVVVYNIMVNKRLIKGKYPKY